MKKNYTVQFRLPDTTDWHFCFVDGKLERLTQAEAERLANERNELMGELGYEYRAVERPKKGL